MSFAEQTPHASASLDDLVSPSLAPLFRRPQRLGKPSGWWGHVPFAAWIVEAVRPQLLVELGTHHGVSYAAFCEAVQHAGLPTRCYAVDHWQGDAHAGVVGDEVHAELETFNRQRYAAFSELVRLPFDEALDRFEDGAIDLLHIDGFHTFEAVQHDYVRWKPKLSARAVVLFHDTNVRRDDFGVHRLFAQLSGAFPHFEFLHGHGLGVIAHGPEVAAPVRQLCALGQGSTAFALRDRFAALGAVWEGLAREAEAQRSFRLQVEALEQHRRSAQEGLDAARGELDAATRARDEALAQSRSAVRAERERDMALGRVHLLQIRLEEAARVARDAAAAATPAPAPEELAARAQLEAEHLRMQAELGRLEEECRTLRSRVDDETAGRAEAQQARDALAQELQRSTEHHAVAVRWFEDVQKERSALLESVAGMRHHLGLYAAEVARMVTDLLRRHSEVVGDAAAPALPDRRSAVDLLWQWRPRSVPPVLRWLLPSARRYRIGHHPVARAVRSSLLFDANWYRATYADVRDAGTDAAYHYAVTGAREGRDPSPWFSTSAYLQQHPELAGADVNALHHFETVGRHGAQSLPAASAALRAFDALARQAEGSGGGNGTAPPTQPAVRAESAEAASAALKERFRADSEMALGRFLADPAARIALPTCLEPEVSVVLVLHNQAGLSFRGLQALSHALDGVPCEVILVDNASTDRTADLLERVDGARVLPQSENLHFLRGANLGARQARGRALLFLNNDAELQPGSVRAAQRLLERQHDVGAVGGKILLLDGTLQEAGSIVWRDGSCAGYGRGQDPTDPAYAFRRDVDYCSGAFLMVRRSLFESLSGFDPLFAPAYYEDADLCMRLRAAGHRVVYEPAVRLVHFEFGSSSSRAQAARLMAQHQQLFVKRHAKALADFHWAHADGELRARTRAPGRPRVLVIDDRIPDPREGAGYPRARDIVNALHAAGAVLTHYPLARADHDAARTADLLPAELEQVTGARRPALGDFLRQRIDQFDMVFVSRPHNMRALRQACKAAPGLLGRARLVYDAEALFSAREALRHQVVGTPAGTPGATSVEDEIGLAREAGVVLTVNESEARAFREGGCADVRVLGHRLDVPQDAEVPAFEERCGFLFVGRLEEEDSPNADSLRWFFEQVLPRLAARLGSAPEVDVVGGCTPSMRARWSGPHTRFHGRVDELRPHYDRARVFIAPTRFAAGIPHKVHAAAANGLPSVVTPLIASQLAWESGEAILSGGDADAFAAACARLHGDAALWAHASASGLAAVARDCDSLHFDAEVLRMLSDSTGMPGAQGATDAADQAARRARTASEWSRRPEERQDTQGLFWMAHPQVVPRLNRLASGSEQANAYDCLLERLRAQGWTFPVRRAASLGCGFGALERGLLQLGVAERIDGYDLAPAAIEEARRLAAREGHSGLTYHVADLERDRLPEGAFDIVFASHSVHHIEQLDALFASVRASLRPGGVFHLQEYVGPDRFQWTDAQLEGINTFMATLPLKYRRFPSGMERGPVGRPSVQAVIDVDPSEAVCSSQIIDALRRHFRIVELRPLGGALLQTGLSGIAQNFDPASAEDRAHLQRFFDFEDAWMAQGRIGSDFAVITAVRD